MGTDEDIFYQPARDGMLRDQLMARGIDSARVLHAMATVPRHKFVLPEFRGQAYDDCALPATDNQTISQPYMVAIMTQVLDVHRQHAVLEIGTGTGYQTAVLAQLAREVYTIERIPALAKRARELLESLGVCNVHFRIADGSAGWPATPESPPPPFDRIMVTAGAAAVPEALRQQLTDGGIMVIPVGGRELQHLVTVTRRGDTFSEHVGLSCKFVPLVGAQG